MQIKVYIKILEIRCIASGKTTMNDVTKINGVGPVLAKALMKNGFASVENIAAGSVTDLATVSGLSEIRGKELIKAAKLLLKNLALTDAARKAKESEKSAPKSKIKNEKLPKIKKLEKKLKAKMKEVKKLEKKLMEIKKKKK